MLFTTDEILREAIKTKKMFTLHPNDIPYTGHNKRMWLIADLGLELKDPVEGEVMSLVDVKNFINDGKGVMHTTLEEDLQNCFTKRCIPIEEIKVEKGASQYTIKVLRD